jgi:hypothetical protein
MNPVLAVVSALALCVGFVLIFTAFLLMPFLVLTISTGALYAAGWRKKHSRTAKSEPSAGATAGGGEDG